MTKAPYVSLDITDKAAVEKVIMELRPDAVIHCAAWTAVDMAEDDDKVEKVRAIIISVMPPVIPVSPQRFVPSMWAAPRILLMSARSWTAR